MKIFVGGSKTQQTSRAARAIAYMQAKDPEYLVRYAARSEHAHRRAHGFVTPSANLLLEVNTSPSIETLIKRRNKDVSLLVVDGYWVEHPIQIQDLCDTFKAIEQSNGLPTTVLLSCYGQKKKILHHLHKGLDGYKAHISYEALSDSAINRCRNILNTA